MNKFKLQIVDWVVILFLFIKLIAIVCLFPQFEMPDEFYHYTQIVNGNERSIYYQLMNQANNVIKAVVYRTEYLPLLLDNMSFGFGKNTLLYNHYEEFNYLSLSLLKMFQVLVSFGFILFSFFLLKFNRRIQIKDKYYFFRLGLLYLSWPSISFSLAGFSSDFPIYLYSIYFFILLFYFNKFWSIFILSILMIWKVDNNPSTMLLMMIIYLTMAMIFKSNEKILSINRKLRILGFVGILLFIYSTIGLIIVGNLFPFVRQIIQYGYSLGGLEPFKAHGALFLSMYYLGGSMSLRAFALEYLFFGMIAIYIIKRIFIYKGYFENKCFLYSVSMLFTFNIFLLTFPVMLQAKYYYYYIPLLIICFEKYILKSDGFLKNKKYFYFSLFLFFSCIIKLLGVMFKLALY